MSKLEMVKCDARECENIHELNSRGYRTVHGNICVGEESGIVGNNIDEYGIVSGISSYCTQCLVDIIVKVD